MVHRLDDAGDSRLACYADLRWNSKAPSGTRWFVVEGRLCVQRLLASDLDVHSVLVQQGSEKEVANWADEQVPIYVLPKSQISELVGYEFHRGLLACGTRPNFLQLADLDWSRMTHPIVLGALGIRERENLGSMLRTAAAMGIQDVLVEPGTADPFARRTIRVSMANVLKQRLYHLGRPVQELGELASDGTVRMVAATLSDDAIPLDSWKPDGRPVVLLMGNEATGLDPALENIATEHVTIPMELGTDSLNVSVATGLCLYELVKRCRP